MHEEMRNAQKILVGKLEGKRQLGRYKYRWGDNIKVDTKNRMRVYGLDSTASG
jgi:hypothetical protein